MGEVYRARDPRLGREIALKVLPAEVTSDPERLARFEREARSASALNHPNIVTIHEIARNDRVAYISMELIDGLTLREILASAPLPVKQMLAIATQAADGLANAHAAGIVHRDLKPENLMVTRDGFVKILDFGLAKPFTSGEQPPAEDLTAGVDETEAGVIFGTVAYMSPEQATGRKMDFRSDQFSLGSVLYEMATGRRAFAGETPIETMAAILRDEPEPIVSVNPEVPAPVFWVIERCLEKDPQRRYASTRDLARDLAALRDRVAEMPVRRPEAARSNLPVARTAILGREREIAAGKEALLRPDVRLLTLTGPGGIGKTRLALEAAREVSDHFDGGVHFVSLAALSDAGRIAGLVAQTVGAREVAGEPPVETLRRHVSGLQGGRILILLDNFEHLLPGAPVVSDLLGLGAGVKVLVTSRAALHVYGEHEFNVSPLLLPDPSSASSPATLSANPAVALFLERAAAVKPGFELTAGNAAAVAEICARLDGLPLAIELAAARVKLLSPQAMRARLESRLQLLTGGARDLPERQQTLRAAMDWSHGLLNEAEQRLFRRLSVFAGGCTLEGVEAVCDARRDLGIDVLDGMSSMVDKSLVQQVDLLRGESRYTMLATVREYAQEHLTRSGEEALTRRAHAAYCLVLAEEGTSESAEVEAEWLDRLEMEHSNLRAALDWLIATKDAEWGLRLAGALFRFWETREYLSEGRDRLAKALELPSDKPLARARARALFAAGVFASEQGDSAAAQSLTAGSLEIARLTGDRSGQAVALNALAILLRDRGDPAAARPLFEASLTVWRELGDRMAAARALSNVANVVKLQGDFAEARELYDECQALFRELGDRRGMAWSINHQGDAARDEGDTETARALYERSLAAFRELDDRWGIAASLVDLGNLARDQQDFGRAHDLYEESIRHFQELGHRRGIARLLDAAAESAAVEGQSERALRLAGAAAALRQALGARVPVADQGRLQRGLETARRSLAPGAGAAAWMEGWEMPVARAVDEAFPPRRA